MEIGFSRNLIIKFNYFYEVCFTSEIHRNANEIHFISCEVISPNVTKNLVAKLIDRSNEFCSTDVFILVHMNVHPLQYI